MVSLRIFLIVLAVMTVAAFAQILQPARPGGQNPLYTTPFTSPAQAPAPKAPRQLSTEKRITQLEKRVQALQDEVNQLKERTDLKFRTLDGN